MSGQSWPVLRVICELWDQTWAKTFTLWGTLALQPGPRFQQIGDGDGGASPIPDKSGTGTGERPRFRTNRGRGRGSVPAPGQIGDGRPRPSPSPDKSARGRDGRGTDGDRGVRALFQRPARQDPGGLSACGYVTPGREIPPSQWPASGPGRPRPMISADGRRQRDHARALRLPPLGVGPLAASEQRKLPPCERCVEQSAAAKHVVESDSTPRQR